MTDNAGRSTVQVIACAASAIVCLQNAMSFMGFTWALIHGVGLESALAFAPAAIALAVIWGGYLVITRRVSKCATPVFAALASAVVVLNELVLPVTPLHAWRSDRALNGVRILAVRDRPLLSSQGNPIGVRIAFDAVVPRTMGYMVSATTYISASTTSGVAIAPLGFGYLGNPRVDPAPTPQPESIYDLFQKSVVYTIRQDMVPAFLRYDEKTKKPCLAEVRTKYISENDFLSALAANRDVPLHIAISVNGEYSAVSVWVADRVTSRRYDMQAIYETIAQENGGRCEPSAVLPIVSFGS